MHILNLSRVTKRYLLIVSDACALLCALWFAYVLRFSNLWQADYIEPSCPLFVFVPIFGISVFIKLGIYRTVIRFMNTKILQTIAVGVGLIILGIYTFTQLYGLTTVPRSVPIIFGLCALLYFGVSRLLIRGLYHWLVSTQSESKRAVIYGAGEAGSQLSMLLHLSTEFVPVAFIDDDSHLWGNQVRGLGIFNPIELPNLIEKKQIDVVLLALPQADEFRRGEILRTISKLPVEVKSMPSLSELLAGKSIDQLREIEVKELLGRQRVVPNQSLMFQSIQGKSVCVTGAGGSIGSELARQTIVNGAKTLVLFEQNELALYEIESELQSLRVRENSQCNIITILGSVTNAEHIKHVFSLYNVETVYHAAAYKHVPLVEHNILQGIFNNVVGTETAAIAAQHAGVERFVFVSTDKAVRPTNIMGATKRLAEMIIQQLASNNQHATVYSMVRFGNVLDSSGSVVPRFKQQIKQGGPVTVTHPDINRYFMTIPEAASLVIQAGSMAEGGEVYVLDMGEPVKINDLALQMIHLSGLNVKDSKNLQGDIEIVYTGLRPGEKLYEELLIGNNVQGTHHPSILKADEAFLDSSELSFILDELRHAYTKCDVSMARNILIKYLPDYSPGVDVVDHLYAKSENTASIHKIR